MQVLGGKLAALACGESDALKRPMGQPGRCSAGRATIRSGLPPDTQLFDQLSVASKIARMEIIQQPAALADQLEQSTARMMVFRVGPKMAAQLLDTGRKERHLDFGGTAIRGSSRVRLNYFPLASGREGHQESCLFLWFFLTVKVTEAGSRVKAARRTAVRLNPV